MNDEKEVKDDDPTIMLQTDNQTPFEVIMKLLENKNHMEKFEQANNKEILNNDNNEFKNERVNKNVCEPPG